MTHVDRESLMARTGIACLSLGLIFYTETALAGIAGEPNIVYANLSADRDSTVDSALKSAVNSAKPECWMKGAGLIYMKKRPPGVTDTLIKRAVLQGGLQAKRSLSKVLLSYKDDEVSGFDGVIVYADKPAPRFISMTVKTLVINSQQIADVRNGKDVELAFCAVKPDVVRAP